MGMRGGTGTGITLEQKVKIGLDLSKNTISINDQQGFDLGEKFSSVEITPKSWKQQGETVELRLTYGSVSIYEEPDKVTSLIRRKIRNNLRSAGVEGVNVEADYSKHKGYDITEDFLIPCAVLTFPKNTNVSIAYQSSP